MNDPEKYFCIKETVVGKLNSVFVPKLFHAMSWNFKNGNILDYGCGPGNLGFQYILPKAEETDSRMYSVDISPEMVEFATKNFPHPRICYGIGSLPYDFQISEKFDRVFSVHVLHFIPDLKPFLKEMGNILKHGGQFGFTTATIEHTVFKTHQYLLDSPTWKPYMKHLRKLMPEWSRVPKGENASDFLRNVFVNGTGLTEVFFLYAKPSVKMTMNQYLGSYFHFAMSINPCIKNVPNNLLGKLREEYQRLIIEDQQLLPDDDATFSCDYICMVLEKQICD